MSETSSVCDQHQVQLAPVRQRSCCCSSDELGSRPPWSWAAILVPRLLFCQQHLSDPITGLDQPPIGLLKLAWISQPAHPFVHESQCVCVDVQFKSLSLPQNRGWKQALILPIMSKSFRLSFLSTLWRGWKSTKEKEGLDDQRILFMLKRKKLYKIQPRGSHHYNIIKERILISWKPLGKTLQLKARLAQKHPDYLAKDSLKPNQQCLKIINKGLE